MNEHEIARIAAMGNALRPDWPTASLRALLESPELINRGRRDVAVALTYVACDSETATPGRVLKSGPWWHAANVETPDRIQRTPPRVEQECREHRGEYAHNCRCCAAEAKGAPTYDLTPPTGGGNWNPARIRAELRGPAEVEENAG